MIRWKGHIEGERWSKVPVDCNDIFPTALDLAGYDVTNHTGPTGIDGRSLEPLLVDPENTKKEYPRDTYFWHYPLNVIVENPEDGFPSAPSSAVREGDWKLIFDWPGSLRLYHIAEDPYENVDVKYTPAINPHYDPLKESRKRPLIDLRRQYLGADRAIRTIENDPRSALIADGIDSHINPSN